MGFEPTIPNYSGDGIAFGKRMIRMVKNTLR